MDKMNANFFRYTLVLLITAVICIVIGGISLSRTIDDPENRFFSNFDKSVYERKVEAQESFNQKIQEIRGVVDNSSLTTEEKNKIYDILERK